MGERLTAAEMISRLVADPVHVEGVPSSSADPLSWPGYRERLEEAVASTGADEAVAVVRGRVNDSGVEDAPEAVFAVWEFGFLGGSMGTVVGERVARAYETAAEARLPVVLVTSTGGARMQEGMASLAQMAVTAEAARAHAETGLLQVAVVRDPTTGGVFASHANLADVVLVEPGATLGFAGPRVAEAMTGGELPEGSHTSEGARRSGLVDDVVATDDLPSFLGRLLSWPGDVDAGAPREPGPRHDGATARRPPATAGTDAWAQVQRARDEGRARASEHLAAYEVVAELHGDRAGADDPAIRVVLARADGRPCVIVAMDVRGNDGRITPAGYRKAWRGTALADRLGVPVVTMIDTPGADASASSEAAGIAHHIARSFTELMAVRSPTVSLVIGEGGSGGALCLAVADRLLIQEHAIFTVIAPEGAAAILHRDSERAPEVAELLGPTSTDLLRLGIAQEVVPEPAGEEVAAAFEAVCRHLDELAESDPDDRLRRRRWRWRQPLAAEARPR